MLDSYIVYGLVDPRTKLVRYIGKSCSGLRRPYHHGTPTSLAQRTRVSMWLRSLRTAGVKREIVVLDRAADPVELAALEAWWIKYGRESEWDLTNLTDGGEGVPGFKQSLATRVARSRKLRGRRAPSRQYALTAKQARDIRELAVSGLTQSYIAQQFGIHQSTVSNVVTRKSWVTEDGA